MIVDGKCYKCNTNFNAHWDQYPIPPREAILHPYCPYCKSDDVKITTDESYEEPIEIYEDEEED
jgi:hypothetical protein